jgi:hypothetical protein
MRIKVQTMVDGVVRDLFINPSAKDLVAIKFTEAELNMLAQWPKADHPLVTGPKGFIAANPQLVNKFVSEWPVEFHNSHKLPDGGVLGPDGRLLDKKG